MTSLMEIDPLFNTLLNQGKSFLNIQDEYKYMVDPHLKLIEQTTSPKLGSLIENFSQNFPDKTNQLAAEVSAVNDDGANTAALQNFISTINQYNATLKNYQDIALVPGMSDDKRASKLNYGEQLTNQLSDLNTMLKKKLSGRTVGGAKGYDYQAGSGEEGAGDQPQLLAMRKHIQGPLQGSLSAQRESYDAYVRDVNTLIGEGSDTQIRAKSAYYKYIVWLIVSITLISYTIKFASS